MGRKKFYLEVRCGWQSSNGDLTRLFRDAMCGNHVVGLRYVCTKQMVGSGYHYIDTPPRGHNHTQ